MNVQSCIKSTVMTINCVQLKKNTPQKTGKIEILIKWGKKEKKGFFVYLPCLFTLNTPRYFLDFVYYTFSISWTNDMINYTRPVHIYNHSIALSQVACMF